MRKLIFGATRTGRRHLDPYRPFLGPADLPTNNQDGYSRSPNGCLVTVYDCFGSFMGTGGWAPEGLNVIRAILEDPARESRLASAPDPRPALSEYIFAIHEGIQNLRVEYGRYPASSLTLLFLHRETAYLSHVGDCRAYLFRDATLRQLTTDHTWVQEQVSAGIFTMGEAHRHPLRDVVLRAVGGYNLPPPIIDHLSIPVIAGDLFILLSDGVWKALSADALHALCLSALPDDLPQQLLLSAFARGADDDLTAVTVILDPTAAA